MLRVRSIQKKLILPDAIELWESRWNGNTRMADNLGFWRFRHYAIGLCVGAVLSLKSFMVGISLITICLLFDYLILRSRAKKLFQKQLKNLKELLHKGFYESDRERQDPYEPNSGEKKIIDSNPVNILRVNWISDISNNFFKSSYSVLDAGCKGGEVASPLSKEVSSICGVDLNRSALKNFGKKIEVSAVQANILHLPFKQNQFNVALCTEVIEHLYDPIQGLNEIANVIKPDGLLVLSTDNRNHLKGIDVLNPLVIFERIIGLVFPKVLMPRNLMWYWGEKIKFYHTAYSRTELISLVKETNYEIILNFSYHFLPGLKEIVAKIKPNMTHKNYAKIIFPIEKILAKIPIIKCLGDHWIFILRKP